VGVDEADGLVESLLDLDGGFDEMASAARRFELIGDPTIADGVVVGDDAGGLHTEDAGQVEVQIEIAPGGRGIGRWAGESLGVAGDEAFVEVTGGPLAGVDSIADEFGDESVLEGAVEPFATAAGLRAVGEDEADGEGVHGDLKGGRWDGASVLLGTVIGADEVAGAVEVERGG